MLSAFIGVFTFLSGRYVTLFFAFLYNDYIVFINHESEKQVMKMATEKTEKINKYKYLPDVRHIMAQCGYAMGLDDILKEQTVSEKIPDTFIPEEFLYEMSDISGRNGIKRK